jgi:hypothetical protein
MISMVLLVRLWSSLLAVPPHLTMCFQLYSKRSNVAIIPPSEVLINKLIRLSVETVSLLSPLPPRRVSLADNDEHVLQGLLCALTAGIEIILFSALPETGLHFVLCVVCQFVCHARAYGTPSVPSFSEKARLVCALQQMA